MSEVLKLVTLHLVVPTTNATNERLFSAMKRIKNDHRNSTIEKILNHSTMIHAHCKKIEQLNMIEVAKDFNGDK